MRLGRALIIVVAVAACGNDDGPSGVDAAIDAAPDAASAMCVQPTDQGNSLGVGTPCTPGGGECAAFPMAPLCLADVGQEEWFCTRIGCTATTDCGTGAGCLIETGGSACVPCRCDIRGTGCM